MTATSRSLTLMVGLPGSGKTTAARGIAAERQALRLTPDEWMVPLYGSASPDLGAPPGTPDRRDVLEGRLVTTGLRLLDLDTSVVLDFGFWGRDERYALHSLARRRGATCTTVFTSVDTATQSERIARRHLAEPVQYAPLADGLLQQWRDQFEPPDDDELAGRTPELPPPGWSSWAAWAEDRWPSLHADAPV